VPARAKRTPRLASAPAIIAAASTLFLRHGYLGTSMDDIAALAGVSKQTVYTHFADKAKLFAELIRATIDRADEFVQTPQTALQDNDDLEQDLRELARRYIASVLQPQVLQLRRLIIGEAGRFPDLARTYHERVPQRAVATLAARLWHLAARGRLHLDDPVLAANHFAWLVLAIPLDEAMFRGTDQEFAPAELEAQAAAGVRVFLAAYAQR
jgi:TetR/AcrR family transcriptional regulator, mexJK operon transcriptional repressor